MSELRPQVEFLEHGMLEPGDYLAMIEEASDPTRYSVLSTIVQSDQISATEVAEQMDMSDRKSRLHYHLDQLAEAELIQNRRANRADEDGFYSYYTATPYGEIVARYVAETLNAILTEEQDVRGQYAELPDQSSYPDQEIKHLERELKNVRGELEGLREVRDEIGELENEIEELVAAM